MYALWDRFGIKLKKLKALLKSALELLFAIVYNMYWYACYFAGCFVIGKFSSYNSSILRHALDVRVASAALCDILTPRTWRAGCVSKNALICVMPVRILCTGFVPYRELGYCPKEELRPLTRFKDAKSPYSYANTPALLCELVIRIRFLNGIAYIIAYHIAVVKIFIFAFQEVRTF